MKQSRTLKQLHIGTPCKEDWHTMQGSDQIRHCNSCNADVYNFAELTRKEAESLINSTDKFCARILRKPDGEIRLRENSSNNHFKIRFPRVAAAVLALFFTANSGYAETKSR